MIRFRSFCFQGIISDQMPEEIADEMEALMLELSGAFDAEGWHNPSAQCEFIAGRLDHYAARFRELAGSEAKEV